MKTKKEIRAKIKELRISRNAAKQLDGTKGYVFLINRTIRTLEWVLGYKRPPQYWCSRCALLHNNLKCPKCGNEKKRELLEAKK